VLLSTKEGFLAEFPNKNKTRNLGSAKILLADEATITCGFVKIDYILYILWSKRPRCV